MSDSNPMFLVGEIGALSDGSAAALINQQGSATRAAVEAVASGNAGARRERQIEEFLLPGETLDPTGEQSVHLVRQRALDELSNDYENSSSGAFGRQGFVLVWPIGNFRVAVEAVARTGVGERGQGLGQTYFYPEGDQAWINGAKNVVNPASTYDDISYSDFTIDGRNQIAPNYNFSIKGIYIQGMKNFRAENVRIRNTWATGFGLDFIKEGDFVNCVAENCGRGHRPFSDERKGSGAGFGYGSGLYPDERVRFINCVSTGNYTYGFFTEFVASRPEITYRSRGVQAVGCQAYENWIGFLDAGTDGAIVSACTLSRNLYAGFGLDGTHASPSAGINGRLTNSIVSLNGTDGAGAGVVFALANVGGYTIEANEIYQNSGPGVRVTNEGAYSADVRWEISKNRIHDNQGAAIRAARGLPSKCAIESNRTWGNTQSLELVGAYTASELRLRFNDFTEGFTIEHTLAVPTVVSNIGLALSTPSSVTATFDPAVAGRVALSWVPPVEPIDNYRVEWQDTSVGTWNVVTRTTSTTPAQVITGLPSFAQLVFRIAGIKGATTNAYTSSPNYRLLPNPQSADFFNRADSNLGGSQGTDGPTPITWTDHDTAQWKVLSGSIRPDSYYTGRKAATFDAGSGDGTISVEYINPPALPADIATSGVLVRYVDSQNYVVLDMSVTSGWQLRKCVAGTYSTILGTGILCNVGDRLIVQFAGNNYTVTVNDSPSQKATDAGSSFVTATRRGVLQRGTASGTRMKWDNVRSWNIAG